MSWDANFDDNSVWFLDVLRKFSTALYRNKFRRVESTDWREILTSTKIVLGISPTSVGSVSYARKNECLQSNGGPFLDEIECERKLLSPSNIVVDFNNATLTLWLQQSRPTWSPFNTFAELGGYALATHSGHTVANMTHWDRVIEKLYSLTSGAENPVDTVDLILSGDAWTADRVTGFEDRLKAQETDEKLNVKNVILQPDGFASSRRSAENGYVAVNTREVCYTGLSDSNGIAHDEV